MVYPVGRTPRRSRAALDFVAWWLLWLVVCSTLWTLTAVLTAALRRNDLLFVSVFSARIADIGGVLLVATLQWLVLRGHIRAAWRWLLVSLSAAVVGALAGWIITFGTMITGALLWSSLVPYETPEPTSTGNTENVRIAFYVAMALAGAVGGLIIGVGQRWSFRRGTPYRTWWVVAWTIGAAVGYGVWLPTLLSPSTNGWLSGLLFGISTGPVMLALRRRGVGVSRRAPASDEKTSAGSGR